MDRGIKALFNIDDKRYKQIREEYKDTPVPDLFNHTPRDILIDMSERWLKEKFGKDVFGLLAIGNLSSVTSLQATIIDDCGFYDEALPIVRRFRPENCFLIRLHREDAEWDSRSYIELAGHGVTEHDIYNKYDKHMFEVQVNGAVKAFLNYPSDNE